MKSLRLGFGLLFAALFAAGQCSAQYSPVLYSSYTVLVPNNGYNFVAYSYAAQTLNQIFPGVPDGFQVFKWSGSNWNISQKEFGAFSPNWTINPGEALLLKNIAGPDRYLTITGSIIPDGVVYRYLTAGAYNAVGYPFPLITDTFTWNNFLEKLDSRYQNGCLNYYATEDDVVMFWDVGAQSWQTMTRQEDGNPYPWYPLSYGVSPNILLFQNGNGVLGRAFFIIPAVSQWWVQPRLGIQD
jgi:hypothetical protein